MIIYISQFLNMAFPKAGILYHNMPVTVMLLLFGAALVSVMIRYGWKERPLPPTFWIVYLLFCLWVLISLAATTETLQPKRIAMALVLIGSPLAVCLGWRILSLQMALRITAAAVIVVAAYAMIQWFGGVEETTIHGLNLAWGDSWRDKPIALRVPGPDIVVKWPSTYQNGNLVGVFYILVWPVLLAWPTVSSLDKRLRFAALSLGIIGLMLCGSRSAVYPFIVMLPVIIWVYYRQQGLAALKYMTGLTVMVVLLAGSLNLSPLQNGIVPTIISRYVSQTLNDPTATGRTVQYIRYANKIKNIKPENKSFVLLFGMKDRKNTKTEGLLAVAIRFGYPAMVLLLGMFGLVMYYTCWKRKYTYLAVLGLITGGIPFLFDGSYQQPPSLINWFFVVGLLLHPQIAEFLTSGDSVQEDAAAEQ